MTVKKTTKKTTGLRPVLVTDIHRGVYYGRLVRQWAEAHTVAVELQGMRHCYYFVADQNNPDKGVYAMAVYGPQPGSKIGPPVNCIIYDISKVVDVQPEAVETWDKGGWA